MASKGKDDFDSSAYTQKVDNHDQLLESLQGKNFDGKVLKAIKDSVPLQKQIKELIWLVIKDKVLWVIATVILVLLSSFFTSLVSGFANKIVG